MLKRFFHLNLNCKNFERSLAFYRMLGFKVVRDIGEGGGKVFERGFHIPNNNARAAMLALGDDPAATQLDLIEWKSPPTRRRPAAQPLSCGRRPDCSGDRRPSGRVRPAQGARR